MQPALPGAGAHAERARRRAGSLALPGERSETAMELFDRTMRVLARSKLRAASPAGSGLCLG